MPAGMMPRSRTLEPEPESLDQINQEEQGSDVDDQAIRESEENPHNKADKAGTSIPGQGFSDAVRTCTKVSGPNPDGGEQAEDTRQVAAATITKAPTDIHIQASTATGQLPALLAPQQDGEQAEGAESSGQNTASMPLVLQEYGSPQIIKENEAISSSQPSAAQSADGKCPGQGEPIPAHQDYCPE